MCGYYSVCVPIEVVGLGFPGKRIIIRIPLPYKLGEAENSENAEEKLRCEAATFIWIREQCPEVSIPYLWGFGFPNGQCVQWFSNFLQPYILAFVRPLRIVLYVSILCSTYVNSFIQWWFENQPIFRELYIAFFPFVLPVFVKQSSLFPSGTVKEP